MEKITLDEFFKKYSNIKENWDFDLFKIVCVKCGSNNVEYNGNMDTEDGYYGESTAINYLVVKCHDCGNALCLKNSIDVSNYFCDCND